MKVMLATASYTGTPAFEYAESLTLTRELLRGHGIESYCVRRVGDCYIPHARNRLARSLLVEHPDADVIGFLDDDVGWPEEAVLRNVLRSEDVICGAYPKKDDQQTQFPVEIIIHEGHVIEQNGLYELSLAAAGFMFIKRRVLEACATDSGRYPVTERDGSTVWVWDIFRTGFIPNEPGGKIGRWWGEDCLFSVMVRNLGFHMWLDPDINFSHRGAKAWKGNIKEAMFAAIEDRKLHPIPRNTVPLEVVETEAAEAAE